MTIYYRVQPVIDDATVLNEGKLEALAHLVAVNYRFLAAPPAARAAALRHNMTFQVVKVTERELGTYSPPSILAKGASDG